MNSEAHTTIIGAKTQLKGEITADEGLTVLGRVEGSIRLTQSLMVDASGLVVADVEAQSAIINGMVVGNVTVADLVHLGPQGRLVGDIRCQRIVMDEGAALRGTISMGDHAVEPVRPNTTVTPPVRTPPRPTAASPSPALRPPAPAARANLGREAPARVAVSSGAVASKNRVGTARSASSPPPAGNARKAATTAATTAAPNPKREKAPRPPTTAGKKSRVKRR